MKVPGNRTVGFFKKSAGLPFVFGVQRSVFLLFMLLLLNSERVNGQLFDRYHRLISVAEEHYFLENNVDSALFYYQRCFESFDFVFARDAVNSVQIAYREGRELAYFLQIAFTAGVRPDVLAHIPALGDFARDSLPDKGIMREYDIYRTRYLARIDVACLNKVYRLGIKDQLNKDHTETRALFRLAAEFGLPGEKNCGVEALDLHLELGRGVEDFLHLRDSMTVARGKNIRYYTLDNTSLRMHIPLVIMLHDYCTYKHHEEALHTAWLNGFIHARDIGCVYDNAFRGEGSECLMVPNQGIFGLNMFVKPAHMDIKKANQLRARWGICSVETDIKKKELEKEGYQFIWDYW